LLQKEIFIIIMVNDFFILIKYIKKIFILHDKVILLKKKINIFIKANIMLTFYVFLCVLVFFIILLIKFYNDVKCSSFWNELSVNCNGLMVINVASVKFSLYCMFIIKKNQHK